MIAIGRMVRISTSKCSSVCPGCGIAGHHMTHDGRTGKVVQDNRDACAAPHHFVHCQNCDHQMQMLDFCEATGHYWAVDVEGCLSSYASEELEDLGIVEELVREANVNEVPHTH